ncbi:ATP-binding protein [Ruficoccus sp. ZRK36]|uniref:sensor histidine kinase n=1 Tax=Ruficoccus sp. ZRK36 TaxID=2866311 RepID=UPI001C73A36C|nr:ATP-binding protein [Ruficoccus sp. ZRK36]QYY36610.1 PAS domain-containing protein [Ruficoccus sp. ZRK36]
MEVIVLLLAVWVLVLLVRLARLRTLLRKSAEAIEDRKSLLLNEKGNWPKRYYLDRLAREINTLTDIRRHTERREESYLHQIETALENLIEAVLVVNDENQLIMANPAARRLLRIEGRTEGKRVESYLQSPQFLELMKRIRAGEYSGFQEIDLVRGKSSHTFEITGAPISSIDPQAPDMTLFVLHDITRLKVLEGIRKEFVANVSHELRTPVTIIKGYSDTLLEDQDTLSPEEMARFLAKIQKNVDRLHLLLEDLLVLSRLEWGTESVSKEPYSLPQIIRELQENIQPRLDAGGQRVLLDVDPMIDRLMIDPIKISRVFQNVCDNITRYAKGFTKIQIRAHFEDGRIRVSIEDDGCGIPSSDLSHIFERFYRVDKGRSRELGGTGLGLSIVKHIIQLHGGEVSAHSVEGEGTRIEFTLPDTSAEADARVSRKRRISQPADPNV